MPKQTASTPPPEVLGPVSWAGLMNSFQPALKAARRAALSPACLRRCSWMAITSALACRKTLARAPTRLMLTVRKPGLPWALGAGPWLPQAWPDGPAGCQGPGLWLGAGEEPAGTGRLGQWASGA